jgi:NAD(P)-dependent dehydrogenase (short-subunit alcohol dehydrogenase family)
MSLEDWRAGFSVNAEAVFLMCRAFISGMRARKWGRIITVSSQLASLGMAERGEYCASKAAVHGLTRALAREVAEDGVTVNAVAPGPVDTQFIAASSSSALGRLRAEIPVRRFASVEEIVPTVMLLALPSGGYYTGAIMNVSGGHVMSAG